MLDVNLMTGHVHHITNRQQIVGTKFTPWYLKKYLGLKWWSKSNIWIWACIWCWSCCYKTVLSMKCIIWLTQKVITLQLKFTFWMYINLSINSSKVFIDRNIIQSEKYPNFCLMFGHIYFRAVYYIFITIHVWRMYHLVVEVVWGEGVLSKYKTCGGNGYSQSIRQAQCVFFQWPPYTSA